MKFSRRLPDGSDLAHRYEHVYALQSTSGPDRICIAPSGGHVQLLRDLVPLLGRDLYVLYVLVIPCADAVVGRYASPALDAKAADAFLAVFAPFLEGDGRHHVWVSSTDGSALAIYDRHDILYTYGPLDSIEAHLRSKGLARVEAVHVPVPHTHHYPPVDPETWADLMGRWAWDWSELRAGDED